MSGPDDRRVLNRMTTRASRELPALAPGYADVDGRSLPELTALSSKLAALYRFYDGANRPDGDWGAFFPEKVPVEDGKVTPHLALHAAFLRLFATAQASVNAFSGRYASFYYRDVLRDGPKGPVGDRAWVTLTTAKGAPASGVTVPKGTAFSGGKDAAGAERVYTSDEALRVMPAALAAIRGVRVVKGALCEGDAKGAGSANGAGGAKDGESVPRQVLCSEVAPDGAPWSTFGGAAAGSAGPETTAAATVGFAVASSQLLLSGGERHVDLRLRFTSAGLGGMLAQLAGRTGLTEMAALEGALVGAFRLAVTTAKGWFELGAYSVTAGADGAGFVVTLGVDLPSGAPAVVAAGGAAGAGSATGAAAGADEETVFPDPATPMLRAVLSQVAVELSGPAGTASVYPLSLLSDAALASLVLSVTVSGVGDVALENTDGPVDARQPFSLLGAAPGVGSFLGIRSVEVFSKKVDSLAVTLAWQGLPANEDGFAGYYRDYVVGLDGTVQSAALFDNATFQVDAAVAAPGRFTVSLPAREGANCLFRTCQSGLAGEGAGEGECAPVAPPAPDGKLAPITALDGLVVKPADPPGCYDPAKSSLRIALSAPAYGFGDCLFAANVLYAVRQDLPPGTTDGSGKPVGPTGGDASGAPGANGAAGTTSASTTTTADPPKVHYPSKPWTPTVASVTVHYTASGELLGADSLGRYYHLLPFGGWAEAPAGGAGGAPSLLPRFSFEGALLLGFTGLAPSSGLTLLFEMAAGERGAGAPAVTWEVLSRDRWLRLTGANVRADGTGGLSTTGILELALPAFDPAASDRLPGGLAWLRAGVTRAAGDFPACVDIVPNAVTVTWQAGASSGADLAKPLPRGTIKGLVTPLAGIDKVTQPLESTGGRPPEDEATFQIRLGERLRHKDRAVLSWDHERLVLDGFPQILKVRALPARSPERGGSPGDVLVVVLPTPESRQQQDPLAPVVPAETLESIRASLAARATPFARIHVEDPAYVRIEVTAALLFRDGEDPGDCLSRLNDDLKAYLSPFADHSADAGGPDYWTEDRLADFVQTRPYVASVDTLSFAYSPDPASLPCYFLTSAATHHLTLAADARPIDIDAAIQGAAGDAGY